MPTNNDVLVVGGAGYIGSHLLRVLQQAGFTPVVFDNLSSGHREAASGIELIEGSILNSELLDTVFANHQFVAVIHFASCIQSTESLQNPAKYYQNNVVGSLYLLQAMLKHNVKNIIFSSSAAVYGEPKYTPIDETHPIAPTSPFGHSKRMVEIMLDDFSRAYGLRYISLRYFNTGGSDPQGRLIEHHEPETHLIPLVLLAAYGKRKSATIYGRDYPTPDGTCVRDYVHVLDLCSAHVLALKALLSGKNNGIYNLGTGHGFSVQQVIDTVREVTERDIQVEIGERREGDPAILVADPSRAIQELNWQPEYSDLHTIIQHAWESLQKA